MSRRGTSPVLIGRATQLAALEAALETVRQGGPAALLIGGEAGVGKSRLIAEFGASAREAGARVLTGECLELGADGLPFGPFTAMLRDLVRELGAGGVTGLLPGGSRATRELARLLPELSAAELPRGELSGSELSGRGEAEARRQPGRPGYPGRVARTAVRGVPHPARAARGVGAARGRRGGRALGRPVQPGPDRLPDRLPASAAHMSSSSSRSGPMSLHRTHPLRPLLAELARIDWVERTELPRLTHGQAEELAAAILGQRPDPDLTDRLYQRAEGNPLFTEELLCCGGRPGGRSPRLAGRPAAAGGPPAAGETPRKCSGVASAGSGSTSHALLARVTGRGRSGPAERAPPRRHRQRAGHDGRRLRVPARADPRGGARGPAARRARAGAHPVRRGDRRRSGASSPTGGRTSRRRTTGTAAHDTTWALIAAWRAAAQPSHAVAHAERLMLLSRVLELWNQVPDAAEHIGVDHVRVLEEAAAAAHDAGEDKRGLAFAAAAIAELDEATAPVRLALLLGRHAMFKENLGIPGAGDDLDRALAMVPEDASPQVRDAVADGPWRAVTATGPPSTSRPRGTALRFAREAGDVAAESKALGDAGVCMASPAGMAARGSEPMRLLAQAREIAQQAGAYHPFLKAVTNESHLLCGAGEYERAADVARQGVSDAERYGLARNSGRVPGHERGRAAVRPRALGRGARRRRAGPGPDARRRAPGPACGSSAARSNWPAATWPRPPGGPRPAGRCWAHCVTPTSSTWCNRGLR